LTVADILAGLIGDGSPALIGNAVTKAVAAIDTIHFKSRSGGIARRMQFN
jgi:hypothetical protein